MDYTNFITIICQNKQRAEIVDFLEKIDSLMPRPISDRIPLSDFADKVLANGKICAAFSDNELAGAVFFYCNDKITETAYLSVLAVLTKYQGKGLGSLLVSELERVSRENGMKAINLKANVNNKKAVALYTKHGFSVLESEIDGDEEKYVMIKRLL